MSYYIIGKLFVERFEPEVNEECGDYEILDAVATSSSPLVMDTVMDLEESIFDQSDVPADPGIYAVMYAALLTFKQDYWGEWDIDVDVEWQKVKLLSEEETKFILEENDMSVEDVQESFKDLLDERSLTVEKIEDGKRD